MFIRLRDAATFAEYFCSGILGRHGMFASRSMDGLDRSVQQVTCGVVAGPMQMVRMMVALTWRFVKCALSLLLPKHANTLLNGTLHVRIILNLLLDLIFLASMSLLVTIARGRATTR